MGGCDNYKKLNVTKFSNTSKKLIKQPELNYNIFFSSSLMIYQMYCKHFESSLSETCSYTRINVAECNLRELMMVTKQGEGYSTFLGK